MPFRAVVTTLLAVCMLMAVGCVDINAFDGPSGGPGVGLVTDKGGRGDQSFNDSAIAGLERAKSLGVECKVLESHDDADYEVNIKNFAEAGFTLIFAVGVAQKDAVEKLAKKYPKIHFAIIDGRVENMPNVREILFNEEQGSFLAGALAGQMTKSNKVGFIGGVPIPLIEKFQAGYEAGVKTVNPNATVVVGYTGKWDDPGKGKDLANAQMSQGVDVIYHASGACGKGIFEAVKEMGDGYWAIGVDSDQDGMEPGKVLTSMVKHVDIAVYDTVEDEKNGKFTAEPKYFGVKQNGVSLTDMKYTRDKIPPEVLKKVDQLKDMIAKGQIQVPDSEEKLKTFQPPKI